MAKTLSLEPIIYVLEFEREEPAEKQTKWHIRPLKWKERAEIQDRIIETEIKVLGPKVGGQQAGVMKHLSGTQTLLALEKGLVKIENLIGPDDSVIKYEKEMKPEWKEGVLDSIPPEWTKEVAEQILRISGLSKEEEKN